MATHQRDRLARVSDATTWRHSEKSAQVRHSECIAWYHTVSRIVSQKLTFADKARLADLIQLDGGQITAIDIGHHVGCFVSPLR
jgi:hypothetical protein